MVDDRREGNSHDGGPIAIDYIPTNKTARVGHRRGGGEILCMLPHWFK